MTKLLHLEKVSEESRALIYMLVVAGVGSAGALFFAVRGFIQ
jgi:hypothetical protein